MVQFFETTPTPSFGSTLGQAIGQGLGFGMQNRFQEQQQLRQQQQQRQMSMQQQQQEASALQQAIQGAQDPQSQLQAVLMAPVSNETKKLFAQSLINQQKVMQPKAPPGGLSGQAVPQQVGNAIQNIIQSNPSANSDQLAIEFDKAGIPRAYSNSYIENRRRQDESRSKTEETKISEARKETSDIRKDIANKSEIARQSIANKERQLEIIDRGNIDDPTVAATLESLPFGYGKRLLNPDTVEYKAGLVEEYKDLRTIFQGQTRVAEIKILENKIADTYYTDEQKKRILKARMKALESDVIRSDVAEDIEKEMPNLGVIGFNREVAKRMKVREKALSDQVIDELTNVTKEAETRKSRTLDINNPEDAEIGRQILQESGGNIEKAYKLAEKKGYKLPKRK